MLTDGTGKFIRRNVKMAVLATPKKNSYILKKGCESRIINSKNSKSDDKMLADIASKFEKNNLKKKF